MDINQYIKSNNININSLELIINVNNYKIQIINKTLKLIQSRRTMKNSVAPTIKSEIMENSTNKN